ncbi:MAG: hypothetical protein ICV83_23710, partial [Cytophagales bacterium]|nr:hypothetical protein [Cytophagales bacterium]
LRGYRIELGEVENALLRHEAVQNAVVELRPLPAGQAGEVCLVAYLAGKPQAEEQALGSGQLREFMSQLLPAYMVPAYFVVLDELPLSHTGKVNRKALPPPETVIGHPAVAYAPPGNDTEAKLVEVFKNVLGKDQIGIHDNFFEIGGNSIRIIRLFNQLVKEYPYLEVADLFVAHSVSTLCALIQAKAPGPEAEVSQILEL